MSNNIDLIVSLMKEAASKNTIQIWLPSLGKEVSFVCLTAAQQKEFLKININSNSTVHDLNKHLLKVIKENCTEQDIDLLSLSLYDRDSIILHYRDNIKSSISLQNNKDVRASDIIHSLKEKYFNNTFTDVKVAEGDITLTLGIPSVGIDDVMYINPPANVLEDEEKKSVYVVQMLLVEALKCVKSITVKDQHFDITSSNIVKAGDVIELLPFSLLNKTYEFISNIKNERERIYSVNDVSLADVVSTLLLVNI
jgi:hypothetical protein